MRRSLVFSASLALAAALGGCGSDGDDTAMPHGTPEAPHGGASPVAEDARRVPVSADSLSFAPSEIRARAGEDLAVVLSSDDLLHDFTIDELDVHVAAEAGETAEGGVPAAEPGRYTFYCSVAGHSEAGMEGTLVVE